MLIHSLTVLVHQSLLEFEIYYFSVIISGLSHMLYFLNNLFFIKVHVVKSSCSKAQNLMY